MFRLTRPVFNQLRKTTTGITGLEVHHDPIPHLVQTYKSTLEKLSVIPETSVYRQGVEALTKHKLNIVQAANGNISEVEKQLDEGQIEESLDIATDELKLTSKMVEWKAYAVSSFPSSAILTCHVDGSLLLRSPSLGNGSISAKLRLLHHRHECTPKSVCIHTTSM